MTGRYIRTILLTLILPIALSAQTDAAQDSPSMLFRGRLATRYSSGFNGTPFTDTLSFRKGTVYYNACLYEDVELRLDAYLDQLQVRKDKLFAPISPDERQIAWFTRGSDLFVNMEYIGIEAPARFFQVVADCETPVFKLVKKKLRSVPGNHNGEQYIGYRDPSFDESIISFYEIQTSFS